MKLMALLGYYSFWGTVYIFVAWVLNPRLCPLTADVLMRQGVLIPEVKNSCHMHADIVFYASVNVQRPLVLCHFDWLVISSVNMTLASASLWRCDQLRSNIRSKTDQISSVWHVPWKRKAKWWKLKQTDIWGPLRWTQKMAIKCLCLHNVFWA